MVPEKINGKYWMYYLAEAKGKDSQMGVAFSEDLLHWTEALDHPVLASRPGSFDSQVVEPGPPPSYCAGRHIFNLQRRRPTIWFIQPAGRCLTRKIRPKFFARSDQPVFGPEMEWEKIGQVPNVVFVEGAVRDGQTLALLLRWRG